MAIILLFTCVGGAQQPVATPESALLANLQRDIAAGQADALDVFFSFEAGQMEAATKLLESNRHLRDVLAAKGYAFHYFEVYGAHEPVHWRRT